MQTVAVILLDLTIVAALVGAVAVWNRLRFVWDRSSFRCRLAPLGARSAAECCPRWSRLKTRAKWRADILELQVGPLWAQTLTIPVRLSLLASIEDEPRWAHCRLGVHPQSLVIERDGASSLKVSVRQRDRTRLAGPFLTVALVGLPSPPRSDRRHRS
ncbi:MAG: hypothetical protein ACJ74U_01085 [Jatrophihabitantaceae bacterium]